MASVSATSECSDLLNLSGRHDCSSRMNETNGDGLPVLFLSESFSNLDRKVVTLKYSAQDAHKTFPGFAFLKAQIVRMV